MLAMSKTVRLPECSDSKMARHQADTSISPAIERDAYAVRGGSIPHIIFKFTT